MLEDIKKNIINNDIYIADDKLEIVANKNIGYIDTSIKKKMSKIFPFTKTWKESLTYNHDKNGNKILGGYFKPIDKHNAKFCTIEKYNNLHSSKKIRYYAYYQKQIRCPIPNIKIISSGNQLIIRILKLENNFISRYTLALDALCYLQKKGVIKYRGKGETEKQIRESMRYVLNRYFRIREYEVNIFFNSKLGKKVFDALKYCAIGKKYPTTLYLKGWKKKKKNKKGKKKQNDTAVKIYNVTAKQEKRDYNLDTDVFKIEITLYSTYCKNKIAIKDLKNQKKIVTIDVLNKRVRFELRQIAGKLGGIMKKNYFDDYLVVENVKQDINKRLSKIELQMARITKEMATGKYDDNLLKQEIDILNNRVSAILIMFLKKYSQQL